MRRHFRTSRGSIKLRRVDAFETGYSITRCVCGLWRSGVRECHNKVNIDAVVGCPRSFCSNSHHASLFVCPNDEEPNDVPHFVTPHQQQHLLVYPPLVSFFKASGVLLWRQATKCNSRMSMKCAFCPEIRVNDMCRIKFTIVTNGEFYL